MKEESIWGSCVLQERIFGGLFFNKVRDVWAFSVLLGSTLYIRRQVKYIKERIKSGRFKTQHYSL